MTENQVKRGKVRALNLEKLINSPWEENAEKDRKEQLARY